MNEQLFELECGAKPWFIPVRNPGSAPANAMIQRPSLLLVLLVVMPLSLLAWLGTYLARDIVQRSERAQRLVLDERFAAVDRDLIEAVRQQTDGFAQSALLPVYLAVGSGSILVLALGWLYHRESTRTIREAQRRVSFVNQVSHELKTPLTNIQLYAEMAASRAEQAEDGTAMRYLSVVGGETSRLSRLINNVLSYARHQRDRLSISPLHGAFDDVVARTVEHWRPLLESRQIAIECELDAAGERVFDPDAVAQILGNLLSNVEKYASQGKFVRVATDASPQGVRLVVEDRGPGIPPGDRERVFEAFERLRSDLTEGVTGTGIGLTISRELARLHGGSLDVDPDCRTGSRFVFLIPGTAQ